ncbi:MAG: tetratricopeptide repeat protein [Balneolaceae bacterium]
MRQVESTLEGEISELLEEAYETRTNNLDRSIELATKAHELSKSINHKELLGKSLSHLALFKMIRAEYDESISMSEEAISYFEELEDEKGVADAKYNIAGVLYKTDQLHSGLVNLISCLKTYRKFDDFHQQARVLKAIGTIYEYFGDDKKALDTYLASVEAARKVENLNLESNALNPISGIYLNRGQIERAMKVIEQSIKLKKETNDIRGLAFALYGRGKVYTAMMEFEKAEKDFNDAISIHEEMGEKLGLGMASHKLGYMYLIADRKEEAKRYLKHASDFGMRNKIILLNFKCNNLLYQIYKEEGNAKEALRYLENYVTEKEAVFNKLTLKVIEDYGLETDLNKI